jgi:hypothetical protein
VLAAGAVFAAAGTAAADNGLHRPPLADAAVAVSPASVAAGAATELRVTFTLGSHPAAIADGELQLEAPEGWTLTGLSLGAPSTCDTADAAFTFGGGSARVSHLSCSSGDTVLLDVAVQTPPATLATPYAFSGSLKTRPGGRRRSDNVWRLADASVTVTTAAPAAPVASAFVGRSGQQLVLGGKTYTFTGLNVYNANSRGQCGPVVDLGSALDQWGAGKEAIRAWFFQGLATSDGQRDWTAFDQTLATAKAHGYRVIVTLANQWADCDRGYGYKTEQWYRSGYRSPDPAGTVSYRDYVAEIVARYKDDPTILMWQLMNEAEDREGPEGPCASDASTVLESWTADVSGLIKSIDPNHLVSLGTLGGGTCGASYTQYQSLHDLSTIDVCEVHDNGNAYATLPGDQWNGMQAEFDFCHALGKPAFVGEIAISTGEAGTVGDRATRFDAKLSAQFAAGSVGEVAWLWSPADSIGYDIGPGDPALDVLGSF